MSTTNPYASGIAALLDDDDAEPLPLADHAPPWFGSLLAALLDIPPGESARRFRHYHSQLERTLPQDARDAISQAQRSRYTHASIAAHASEPAHSAQTPRVWTHTELMNHPFPAHRWLVDGLLPAQGLTVLAGKKKLGKSWLAAQILVAAAQGSPFLGRATLPGPVLYICLEDGDARLQARLLRQRAPHDLPAHYCFGPLYPLDSPSGMQQLEAVARDAAPTLLIIDTLAAARSGRADENDASSMAALTNDLRNASRSLHTAVLLVAHHGKRQSGADAGDDIRGSSAIAAASDANLGLYRSASGYLLRVEGRDMPESAIPLALDPDTMQFSAASAGQSADPARPAIEQDILDALADLGHADAQAIAEHTDRDRARIAHSCRALAERSEITVALVPTHQGAPRRLYALP